MNLEFIGSLGGLAVVIEAIINIVKSVVTDKKLNWKVLISMLTGVTIAILYDIDLVRNFGMSTTIPVIGNILSGILLSRGSNFAADLMKLLDFKIYENKLLIKAAETTVIINEEQESG